MTTENLFRPEATRDVDDPDFGSVLRLARWWVPPSFWLLLAAGVAACVVAARGSWPVYESGIAVVVAQGANPCSFESLILTKPQASPASERQADGNAFVAVIAGGARTVIPRGTRVALRSSGDRDVAVESTIDGIGEAHVPTVEERKALVALGAEPRMLAGQIVPVCGRLVGAGVALPDGSVVSARVKLREERVLGLLLARFR